MALPIRDDVTVITYHRNPTPGEIRFGHGAIHYRDFTPSECCHRNTRILSRSSYRGRDRG